MCRFNYLFSTLVALVITIQCSAQNCTNIKLRTIYGTPITTNFIRHYTATVVVILAPECPICINYTPTLIKLSTQLKINNIQLIGVFCGTLYNTTSYQQFAQLYAINFPLLHDAKQQLQHALLATHTPHCFIINNKGAVIYKGLLDNKNAALGAHRTTATINYVLDNCTDYINNTKLRHANTTPVGCLIE